MSRFYDEYEYYDEYSCGEHIIYAGMEYDEYTGSYAHDVMGFSDEDIDEIFEGDPDNYWNID